MTDKHQYAREVLIQLREEVGTSVYDYEIKALNRQRLENGAGREKRKRFPWSKYKRLYERQRGICLWCVHKGKSGAETAMILIRGKVEIDHVNPNEKDFNADFNLQLLHWECNREKSSMSIAEQAKHLGTTFREILGENEP